jgi:hypothetical protein
MLLAGQQLGRFRTNSAIFIFGGISLTLLLLSYEAIEGVREIEDPPDELVFFVLAMSFLTAALFTHIDKKPNYRAKGPFPQPTLVEIYTDDTNVWRYALYSEDSPLDPTIESADSMEKAQASVKEMLVDITGIEESMLEWVTPSSRREALCFITKKET